MAYSYARAIRTNPAKVPYDLTNFPVLISGTFPYLATVANGGTLQSASGFDFAFFADPFLRIPLKFERLIWSATTGLVELWVKFPMLSSFSFSYAYLGYSDAGIASDQADPANVWTNGYNGVFHLGDGTTLSASDSTGLTAAGTITGATAAAGEIGGAASYNAPTSSDAILTNLVAEPTLATYSIWQKTSQTVSGGLAPRLLTKGTNPGATHGSLYAVIDTIDGAGAGLPAVPAIVYFRGWGVDATTDGYWYMDRPANDVWNKIDICMDIGSATNQPQFFLNGDPVATNVYRAPTGTAATDTAPGTGQVTIGNRGTDNLRGYGGQLDEFQSASVLRSYQPGWIKAAYNNESSPDTFHDIGPAFAVPPYGSYPTAQMRAFGAGLF